MRRFVLLCLCFAMNLCFSFGDTGSREVLFRIDGEETSVEEFQHYYARIHAANGVSVSRFFPHFLCYKLKVADAKKRSWDTLPDFRLQCNALQGEILKTAEGNRRQEETSKEWVKFRQITILLPQHVSSVRERAAKLKLDSVYAVLKEGVSFELLASSCVQNVNNSLYPDDEWIPKVCLVKEFSEQLNKLNKDEYSAPFFSPLGIHIVCLQDRMQSEHVPESVSVLSLRESRSELRENQVGSTEIQLKQISDGLLAAYWDRHHAGMLSAKISDKDLQVYFEEHKKDYAWDLPHFKGGVIHCLNKKAASKLKKRLKKRPLEEWGNEIALCIAENPDLKAELSTGLFQIGKNPYIDKLAFKCGDFTPRADLPYTFVLGKRLKKGPEDFTDVREELYRDYRLLIEKSQLEELKRSFRIEINQDILKTVNSSGKN